MSRNDYSMFPNVNFPKVAGLALVALLVVVVLGFGLSAAGKSYTRYQKIADVNNNVKATEIQIRNTEQLVKVEEQKAQIRIAEANGIAEAQQIIDSSLTTNYLRYLAIQAQMEMSNSPNNTTVYIPSGEGGIPLVKEVE